MTYPVVQLAAAVERLIELLPKLSAGEAMTVAPRDDMSRYRTHPTLWSYVSVRARLGVR